MRLSSKFAKIGLLSIIVASQMSCVNLLREFGDRSSDEYLIVQARQYLDDEEFDLAISTIDPVLTTQPTNEDVVYIKAATHAGRAGLRILDLFTAIANESSTKTFFEIFAEHFAGATEENFDDIETAADTIETFSDDYTGRSSELNLFSVFIFYSRIGVALGQYAYDSEAVQYTNFSACHKVLDLNGAKTGLPDEMVDVVMTSIPKIIDALSGVTIQGGAVDSLRSVELPDALSEEPIPCSANSNNAACLIVRTAINVGLPSGFGLGTGSQFIESPGGLCVATTP
jgi:hypothetical protein